MFRTKFTVATALVLALAGATGLYLSAPASRADDLDDVQAQAERDAEQAQRDAEQAQRDAEQARRDAEIARRNAEAARRDADTARRDARQHGAGGGRVVVSGSLDANIGDFVRSTVDSKLAEALTAIGSDASLPKPLRKSLSKRLEKVRGIVAKRTAGLRLDDLSALEQNLESMGQELEAAMAGLDAEMQAYGDQFGKLAEKWTRDLGQGATLWGLKKGKTFTFGDDSIGVKIFGDVDLADPADPVDPVPPVPPVPPMPPMPSRGGSIDVDLSDLDVDVDLGDLDLRPDQRGRLKALVDAEERVVEPASERLDALGEQLRQEAERDQPRQGELDRLVDAMAAQEAIIRKAKLRAWTSARAVLDPGQRRQLGRP